MDLKVVLLILFSMTLVSCTNFDAQTIDNAAGTDSSNSNEDLFFGEPIGPNVHRIAPSSNLSLRMRQAFQAGHTDILLEPGLHYTTETIDFPSSVRVSGFGARIEPLVKPELVSNPDPTDIFGYHAFSIVDQNNLSFEGLEFDMGWDGVTLGPGVTQQVWQSAFYAENSEDLFFDRITVKNGGEEAWKLYSVRNVTIQNFEIDNIFDNGIQIHIPAGYGFTKNSQYIEIKNGLISRIDDRLFGSGNGIGITIQGGMSTLGSHDVTVDNVDFVNVGRAVWGENNYLASGYRNLIVRNCTVDGSIVTPIGLVGFVNSVFENNVLRNIGNTPFPSNCTPSTCSSEVAGFIVSSSPGIANNNISLRNNSIQLGAYGVPGFNHNYWVSSGTNISINNSPVPVPCTSPANSSLGWSLCN